MRLECLYANFKLIILHFYSRHYEKIVAEIILIPNKHTKNVENKEEPSRKSRPKSLYIRVKNTFCLEIVFTYKAGDLGIIFTGFTHVSLIKKDYKSTFLIKISV